MDILIVLLLAVIALQTDSAMRWRQYLMKHLFWHPLARLQGKRKGWF